MSEHRLEDCDLVLSRVHEFLDNELDTATADQIREHLLACEECVEHFDAEAAMRALISRCCQARAPQHLRMAVIARIRTIQIERG
ncbi:mycothiol system anti-sigma-R factor [Granulicoccus phenolivorans]|uniref:mycothiol system anti-sigma-R factor n=1 Tax=Granulicoccus phenolivorans TaxID=266854 RepID=UPI00041BE8ED|nr:mycothiol system anti-sigma-R factor [Granulicoccus phenolivorans]